MLLSVFEALNTKQSFFPAVYFEVVLYHIDEWAGKSSLLETEFGLGPKTIIHFHITTARTACPPLVLTPPKGKSLKSGEKFLCVRQKLWSFLFSNFIKQKKKTQQIFSLNLTTLFYNQCPKRPTPQHLSINVYLYEGRIQPLHQQALQEGVCSLLNLPGCSSTAAAVGPLSPYSGRLKVVSQRALCPDWSAQESCLHPCQPVSSCASPCPAESPLFPHQVTLASLAWLWPPGTDTGVETLLELAFPLFIRLMHHSQKMWWLQIPLSAAGTSHFQTLPPLKKWEGQDQDKMFSLCCDFQDLKHLSFSLHTYCSCIVCCLDLTRAHTSLSASSIIINPM